MYLPSLVSPSQKFWHRRKCLQVIPIFGRYPQFENLRCQYYQYFVNCGQALLMQASFCGQPNGYCGGSWAVHKTKAYLISPTNSLTFPETEGCRAVKQNLASFTG